MNIFATIVIAQLTAINGALPTRCQHDDATVWHSIQWFRTTAPNLRGVVLMMHGLNQKPSALNPLAVELNNSGLDVLRLDLSGHGGNCQSHRTRLEAFAEVTADLWLHEALCAYEKARVEASAQRVPLFLVAFSLGGLVGVELLDSGPPQVHFERMVLLAPAIRTHSYVRAIRVLSPWPHFEFPSAAPEAERANDATPIAAYEALFELQERFETPRTRRINIPTLVLMDEDDELVDAEAIRAMIAEHGLHAWSGASIVKGDDATGGYHHAMTSVEHVGRATWASLVARIRRHLVGAP